MLIHSQNILFNLKSFSFLFLHFFSFQKLILKKLKLKNLFFYGQNTGLIKAPTEKTQSKTNNTTANQNTEFV